MAKIVSIESIGVGEVYDIPHVPVHHNFFCGDNPDAPAVCVHNCVDETNFMRQGAGTANKAANLVNSVTRRLTSRFQQEGGSVPGVCILMSSKRTEEDFTEQRIRDVRKLPGVMIVDGPKWEFDHRIPYCGKTFRAMLGTGTRDAILLDSVSRKGRDYVVTEAVDKSELYGSDQGDLGAIINIPVEYYQAFVGDLVGSLQEVAGVAAESTNPLFPSKTPINQCVDSSLPKLFSSEVYRIHVASDTELFSLFNLELATEVVNSIRQPIRHPEAPRYLHFDLSKNNDRTGFVMLHPSEYAVVPVKDTNGEMSETVVVKYEVDCSLAIQAGIKGEHIDYQKLRNFVFWLRERGFWVRSVTFDSYQSEDSIQAYTKAGIQSAAISVDRTDAPYKLLRSAVVEGRVSFPDHSILRTELADLVHDTYLGKVDHRETGSKDVSDALCAAHLTAVKDKLKPADWAQKAAVAQYLADEQSKEQQVVGLLRDLLP